MAIARCTIEGNVGADPDVKFSKDGATYVKFPIAVTERKRVDGEWEDGETTWYRCTAFKTTAEFVAENVDKGDSVLVDGRMKLETWTGDDGAERSQIAVTAERVGLVRKKGRSRGRASDSPY